MVIFMTGGTGNIGQYVTLELLKRGHKIKLLSRTPDRIKAFSQMENVELNTQLPHLFLQGVMPSL